MEVDQELPAASVPRDALEGILNEANDDAMDTEADYYMEDLPHVPPANVDIPRNKAKLVARIKAGAPIPRFRIGTTEPHSGVSTPR